MDSVAIRSFPIALSREDAMAQASKKGGPFGKLLLMGKEVRELRLHFVEYSILIFQALHSPNFVSRTFFGDRDKKAQLCRVIANGTTGGAAWAEEIPQEIEERTVPEDQVQGSQFSLDQLTGRGQKLVLRVLRRRIGGLPEVTLKEAISVYRPFYVALYGEAVEGTKIRYLPIAADGWGTHRTF